MGYCENCETEVIGLCKEINSNGDMIIIDDDGDEINMDEAFFKEITNPHNFVGKRISFYYSSTILCSIEEIGPEDKQVNMAICCHNYMITSKRMLKKLKESFKSTVTETQEDGNIELPM